MLKILRRKGGTMPADQRVFICAAARSPMVKARTFFKNLSPSKLGRIVLREMLTRLEIDFAEIEELIVGNVRNPYDSPNIARLIALEASIPEKTPCYTINQSCGSSLQAAYDGFLRIKSGQRSLLVVGGVESMSSYSTIFHPQLMELVQNLRQIKSLNGVMNTLKSLREFDKNLLAPIDTLRQSLVDPFSGLSMGQTAEVLAKEFRIPRQAQDEYALSSHKKAIAAISSGRFKEEIIGIPLMPHFDQIITTDTIPHDHLTFDFLASKKPLFETNGTVSSGNCSPLTDGASFLLLANEQKIKALELNVLGEILDFHFVGVNPKYMGLGPVFSIPPLLRKLNLVKKDIDLFEINEAFAVQVIANMIALRSDSYFSRFMPQENVFGEIDPAKLNVNGGAISLGHPFGASGARLMTTMIHELIKRDLNKGLIAMPMGGGQGGAVVLGR